MTNFWRNLSPTKEWSTNHYQRSIWSTVSALSKDRLSSWKIIIKVKLKLPFRLLHHVELWVCSSLVRFPISLHRRVREPYTKQSHHILNTSHHIALCSFPIHILDNKTPHNALWSFPIHILDKQPAHIACSSQASSCLSSLWPDVHP